MSEIKD